MLFTLVFNFANTIFVG